MPFTNCHHCCSLAELRLSEWVGNVQLSPQHSYENCPPKGAGLMRCSYTAGRPVGWPGAEGGRAAFIPGTRGVRGNVATR